MTFPAQSTCVNTTVHGTRRCLIRRDKTMTGRAMTQMRSAPPTTSPDNGSQCRGRKHDAEILPPVPRRHHVADDQLDEQHDAAASQALDSPASNHSRSIVSAARDAVAQGEHDNREDGRPAAPRDVAKLGDAWMDHGLGKEDAVGDGNVFVAQLEVLCSVRQRNGNDGSVERCREANKAQRENNQLKGSIERLAPSKDEAVGDF
ncbi:hypothetical protein E5D57_011081 [Metarhizium anisopliae]|nr:hypothetical protein E5D57_011081 [Metarhizium anisopliae]